MTFGRWGQLARTPGVLRLVLPASSARVAMGMVTLLLVLVTTAHHGSYSTAGVVTACFGVGSAASAPVRGRVTDRLGMRPVLVATGCGETVAIAAFLVASVSLWPLLARCVLAVAMGLLAPPGGAMMRSLWRAQLSGELRDTAFALESVVTDLVYVAGPLLVTITLIVGSADVGFVMAGVLVALGSLLLATTGSTRRVQPAGHGDHRDWMGALRVPALRRLFVVAFLSFGALAAVDFGAIAAAKEHGATSTAGVLVAALSVGSIAGGLYSGSRTQPGSLRAQFLALSAVLGAGFVALSVVPGLVGVGIVLAVSGIAVAPMITVQYASVERVAPDRYVTEAFTWINAASSAGGAAATAIAGTLVGHFDAGGAFLLAGAMTLLGTVLTATMVTGEAPANVTGR